MKILNGVGTTHVQYLLGDTQQEQERNGMDWMMATSIDVHDVTVTRERDLGR